MDYWWLEAEQDFASCAWWLCPSSCHPVGGEDTVAECTFHCLTPANVLHCSQARQSPLPRMASLVSAGLVGKESLLQLNLCVDSLKALNQGVPKCPLADHSVGTSHPEFVRPGVLQGEAPFYDGWLKVQILNLSLWMVQDERGHSSSIRVNLLHFYLTSFQEPMGSHFFLWGVCVGGWVFVLLTPMTHSRCNVLWNTDLDLKLKRFFNLCVSEKLLPIGCMTMCTMSILWILFKPGSNCCFSSSAEESRSIEVVIFKSTPNHLGWPKTNTLICERKGYVKTNGSNAKVEMVCQLLSCLLKGRLKKTPFLDILFPEGRLRRQASNLTKLFWESI